MPTRPDVAIVIVSFNTIDMLRDCLRSVYEQTKGISFEVFVVDNNSEDGSPDMVRAEFPGATLIANAANKGFAAANNQAIRITHARHVLLLNPDTIVLDGAVTRCVAYLDAHPDVGALGCKVLGPDKRVQGSIFRFANLPDLLLDALGLSYVFKTHRYFGRKRYGDHDANKEREVDCVAGCYMLVSRRALDKAGLLDEDFFMYGEEMEWCWRIWKSGARIVYFPGASIVHLLGQSTARYAGGLKIAKRRGVILCLDKTHTLAAAWTANLIILLGVLVRLPAWTAIEITNAFRGRTNQAGARLRVLAFHSAGLFYPIWRRDIR